MKNLLSSAPRRQSWALLDEFATAARRCLKENGLAGLVATAVALGTAVALTGTTHAAITTSFSPTDPTPGPNDISNLTGAPSTGGGSDNVSAGNSAYIANNQAIVGQTFTTGPNPLGYQLTAVTLRQVTYNTYCEVYDMLYTVRITSPSGGSLSVLASETASVTNGTPGNIPTIYPLYSFSPGSGIYITFTFDCPLVLSPNTTYAFDVGGGGGYYYWETDGTISNAYAGGTAYSSGANGVGNSVLTAETGDRVFVVALNQLGAPALPCLTSQPKSVSLYAGETARFTAGARGSPTLNYQWRKNGTNISNGGNIAGALTDSLTLGSISVGDAGDYTLVVANSAGSITTAPPAMLTVVTAPAPGSYAYSVFTNNPLAYWRLDETGNPTTNPLAYDYTGGLNGTYETGSANGFNGIVGPRPSAFPGFASTNNAVQTTGLADNTTPTWVTVPGLNLNTNTITISGWIYPNGNQVDYTGLFMTRNGTDAGLSYGGDYSGNARQLIYTWNNGSTWTYVSGLEIPTNQWSFVAVVIEPTRGTLYLGSTGALSTAVNPIPHQNEAWGGNAQIGGDQNLADNRIFNGSIDEVAVFKRSLSFDEINALYGTGLGSVQARRPTILKQPQSSTLYAGRSARFEAIVTGSSSLIYQWQRNSTNVSDGGGLSGATTDTLTIATVAAGDAGAYTLVVTNSAGATTSAPPAMLAVGTPTGAAYEGAVLSANPLAYWRLNETGNPSTNSPAYDYWGGFNGSYGSASENGFNSIAGPLLIDWPGFESNNNALKTTANTANSWATVPGLGLNTDTVTFTIWISPLVDHNNYHGVFYTRQGSATAGAGINYTIDNQIGYTWNGGNQNTWGFYSGLKPPANQWSFVAVVIEPTKATLYLYNANGLSSTNNAIPHTSSVWDGSGRIGNDENNVNRTFDGMIDEVAVFNYALTPAQVLNLYNAAARVTLSIQPVGANVQLSWPQGTLLEANDVTGPWTTNNAASPYTIAPTAAKKFYRVQVP